MLFVVHPDLAPRVTDSDRAGVVRCASWGLALERDAREMHCPLVLALALDGQDFLVLVRQTLDLVQRAVERSDERALAAAGGPERDDLAVVRQRLVVQFRVHPCPHHLVIEQLLA